MTEEEKIKLSAGNAAKQKSLELLFDYTKFHMGLYLTLTAVYVTVATAKINGKPIVTLIPEFFWPASAGVRIVRWQARSFPDEALIKTTFAPAQPAVQVDGQ